MTPAILRPKRRKIKLSGRVCPLLYEVLKLLAIEEKYADTNVFDWYLTAPILMSKCGRQMGSGEYDHPLTPRQKAVVKFSTIHHSY